MTNMESLKARYTRLSAERESTLHQDALHQNVVAEGNVIVPALVDILNNI